MAKKPKAPKDPNKPGRIKQIRQSYTMTKKSDPRIGLILLGVFLLAGAGRLRGDAAASSATPGLPDRLRRAGRHPRPC